MGYNPTSSTIVPANGDAIVPGYTLAATNMSFFNLIEIAEADLQVTDTSVYALLDVDPVVIGPLTISAQLNSTAAGPHLRLYTSANPPNASYAIQGAISLLGTELEFDLSVAPTGFSGSALREFGDYGSFMFNISMSSPDTSIWSQPVKKIIPALIGSSLEFEIEAAFNVSEMLAETFADVARPLVAAMFDTLEAAQTVFQAAATAFSDASAKLNSTTAALQSTQSDVNSKLTSAQNNVDTLTDTLSSQQSSYDGYAFICGQGSCSLQCSACDCRRVFGHTVCFNLLCDCAWGPDWSSASMFPGASWDGSAYSRGCDLLTQAGACVQAGLYEAEYQATKAAYDVATAALTAAEDVADGVLDAAQDAVDAAQDALNIAQAAMNSAAADVSSAASALGVLPGAATSLETFLDTIFDLISFTALFQYAEDAIAFSASISFTFMGSSTYSLALSFGTSVDAVKTAIESWVKSTIANLISDAKSSRRHLLQVSSTTPTALTSAATTAAAAQASRKAIAAAVLAGSNTTLVTWNAKRAYALGKLQDMASAGGGISTRYAQFMAAMENVTSALADLRGTLTVTQVATYALSNLSVALSEDFTTSTDAVTADTKSLFRLSKNCTTALTGVGPDCERKFASVAYACIVSAGTDKPQLCTKYWDVMMESADSCSAVITSSCTIETFQLITNFMHCSSACATEVVNNVRPACGGAIAVRDYASLNATAATCAIAAQIAVSGPCLAAMTASDGSCFDLFDAVAPEVREDMQKTWRDKLDPTGKLGKKNLTSATKGFTHLHDQLLLGALNRAVCDDPVKSISMGANDLMGPIPSCLLVGGYSADILHVDLHRNRLSGALPRLGQSIYSLSVAQNKLSGDVRSVTANATSLRELDLSNNTAITGTLSFVPKLANLRYLNVLNTSITDDAAASAPDLLALAPKLLHYVLGAGTFNTTVMRHVVPATVRGTLVITRPISEYCSACAASTWGSDCAELACASTDVLASLVCQMQTYLNAVVPAGAPHSVTLGRLVPVNVHTVAAYTTDAAPAVAPSVVRAMLSYTNTSAALYPCNANTSALAPAGVVASFARVGCPVGRLGPTCNYFCAYGWRARNLRPVRVSTLSAFSSANSSSGTPTFQFSASANTTNCSSTQAANDTTCIYSPDTTQFITDGYSSNTVSDALPSTSTLNCSSACTTALTPMTQNCDTWMHKSYDDPVALANCTASMSSANATCHALVAGACPSASLNEADKKCGADDARCFTTRATPYNNLMNSSTDWGAAAHTTTLTVPVFTSNRTTRVISDAYEDMIDVTDTLIPHCVMPPCSNACNTPLTTAFDTCVDFLYDATNATLLSSCNSSLALARSACPLATCYAPLAAGFERILNGSAATADAATASNELGVTFDVSATLSVSGYSAASWGAAQTQALTSAWATKLGVPSASFGITVAGSSSALSTLTLAITVTANVASMAYALGDTLRATSAATAIALLQKAGLVAATAAAIRDVSVAVTATSSTQVSTSSFQLSATGGAGGSSRRLLATSVPTQALATAVSSLLPSGANTSDAVQVNVSSHSIGGSLALAGVSLTQWTAPVQQAVVNGLAAAVGSSSLNVVLSPVAVGADGALHVPYAINGFTSNTSDAGEDAAITGTLNLKGQLRNASSLLRAGLTTELGNRTSVSYDAAPIVFRQMQMQLTVHPSQVRAASAMASYNATAAYAAAAQITTVNGRRSLLSTSPAANATTAGDKFTSGAERQTALNNFVQSGGLTVALAALGVHEQASAAGSFSSPAASAASPVVSRESSFSPSDRDVSIATLALTAVSVCLLLATRIARAHAWLQQRAVQAAAKDGDGDDVDAAARRQQDGTSRTAARASRLGTLLRLRRTRSVTSAPAPATARVSNTVAAQADVEQPLPETRTDSLLNIIASDTSGQPDAQLASHKLQ